MTEERIHSCRIHPGIGISRLGNSPDAYFVGPEVPGQPSGALEEGFTFKDSQGRIKRQAARFRVYAYDERGRLLRELTAHEATLTWTVQLANTKASGYRFEGAAVEQALSGMSVAERVARLRNGHIVDAEKRGQLEIKPRARSISGVAENGIQYRFDDGTFLDTPVSLGELRTDDAGRLLVLGGHGYSGSVAANSNPITHYANNDHWFDDTSDGRVTARVVLPDGTALEAEGAWVIVAPPDFSPSTQNLIRLYDVMEEVAVNLGWLQPPARISFTRDIYPLLERLVRYQWVSGRAFEGHGPGRVGDFLAPAMLRLLADNSREDGPAAKDRQRLFSRLRKPGAADVAQSVPRYMPPMSGDGGDAVIGKPDTWLTLLKRQYEMLARWAEGDFEADLPPEGVQPSGPRALVDVPLEEQPRALERAALEACVGGPFYPGIEMSHDSRDPGLYSGPFRFRQDLQPGAITQRMALPWQADFYECRSQTDLNGVPWWPAQRPDDVFTESAYEELLKQANFAEAGVDLQGLYAKRERWDRGIGEQAGYDGPPRYAGDNDMVHKWGQLGFIVPRQGPGGDSLLVETERGTVDTYEGMEERDFFYLLMNIDSYPEFLPKARSLAQRYLAEAEARLSEPDLDSDYRYFAYSPEELGARLNHIYDNLVTGWREKLDEDLMYQTRENTIERIRQFAPFNQTDGAWLQRIGRVGPITEVHSLLFSIWADEVGGGRVEQNHANIYTDLLHQVGIYLPEPTSRAYAQDQSFLSSAFTVPVMQLAISHFPDLFFPELLGMTLHLEWEVVGSNRPMMGLQKWNLNSHFYRMHIAIDNAVNGHGAKARRAVELYLDQVYKQGGESVVQAQWRRIWIGYVAFATTGNLGRDLTELINRRSSEGFLRDSMIDLIRRKASYARFNHGDRQLAGVRLNDWFQHPEGFVDALAESRWIIPGAPERSEFLKLLNFDGPMLRVFTEEETELIKSWIRSLKAEQPPVPPVKFDPAEAMLFVLERLRADAKAEPSHQSIHLVGKDPQDPSRDIQRTLQWWLEQPLPLVMEVLALEGNELVVRGAPDKGRFVKLITGGGRMAQAFQAVVPPYNKTGREIVLEWIKAGCPQPIERAVAAEAVPRLMLGTPRALLEKYPNRRIRGMGAVH